MKLLIDIGNTNASFAFAEKEKPGKRFFLQTLPAQIKKAKLSRLLGRELKKIEKVIIVSVVPHIDAALVKELKKIKPGVPILVVGKDIKVPIKNRYKNPCEVGQDRLVIAYAAFNIAHAPFLVIDFGTAVTFDYVNAGREYEGGLIFPGLRLSLKTLVENTALLPPIHVRPETGLVGKDTRSSMNKGLLLGYAALCDGIVERFRKKFGRGLNVLATGGDAALVSKYTRNIKKVYPDLIFTGLNLLSQ